MHARRKKSIRKQSINKTLANMFYGLDEYTQLCERAMKAMCKEANAFEALGQATQVLCLSGLLSLCSVQYVLLHGI
jgi:hypothetical protein